LRKVFLMVAVMTLHSLSEGLGIGVSFTGKDGAHLGAFISASLAMHNIPEGLAVALVLMPRGVSKFGTVLWSIFTSMPQPLIAVPVFMFASHFIFWQSVGLGFAAGSMIWVTSFELLADAIKDLSVTWTAVTTVTSFAAGHILRQLIEPAD
jgi:ZIP family zinc transporter